MTKPLDGLLGKQSPGGCASVFPPRSGSRCLRNPVCYDTRMTKLDELLDKQSPAWPMVAALISSSPRKVEVLPRDPAQAERTLVALDVTTRTTLGAVAWETAGILVDDGWLRILGSGSDRIHGSLLTWNGLAGEPRVAATGGSLIVAHDVLGGVFAMDGGGLGPGKGDAYYLAPDNLEWEDLEMGYTQLIHFFLTGDLGGFYESFRWPGWRGEVRALRPDQSLSLDASGARRPVPSDELFRSELAQQSKQNVH